MPIDRQPHRRPYGIETAHVIRFLLYGLLIFAPLARGSVQDWSKTVIQMITLTGLTVFGIQSIWRWQWNRVATPLDKPLILLLLLAVVSTFFSRNLHTSLDAIALLGNYIIIYFMTIYVTRYRSGLRQLVFVVIGIAVLLAFFGFIKKTGSNPFPWWNYADIHQGSKYLVSTFGNRNHMAGYLEMVIPLALGMLLIGQKPGMTAFLVYLTAMLLTALIMTLSRGGWFSAGVGLIFMAGALLKNPYYAHKRFLGIGVTVFFFLLLIILANSSVVERILTLTETELDHSFQSRILAWKACIGMIASHPFMGSGPGTFAVVFTQFHPPGFSDRFFEAHNDYLQMVSEVGLLIIPVVIWLLIALFRQGFKKLNNPSRLVRGITIGALSGISAILCHSVVDFNLHIPANALLFIVLAGIVGGPIPKQKETHDYVTESSYQRSLSGIRSASDPFEVRD